VLTLLSHRIEPDIGTIKDRGHFKERSRGNQYQKADLARLRFNEAESLSQEALFWGRDQTEEDMETGIRSQYSANNEMLKRGRRPSLQVNLEITLGFLSLFAVFLPEPSFAAEARATITVLVYNHSQASSTVLAGAEREAGRILDAAGVRAVWLDCLASDPAADPQGLCHKAREPIDVVLRVLRSDVRNRLHDPLWGFAFPPSLASVSYGYTVRLATTADAIPIILGCAIAHEVGHLLLGPNSHSAAGIMQGEWEPKQFPLILRGGLLFTSQQSNLIQAEARRRMRLQTASLKEQ
jgi:hypothetical protein